MTSKKDIKDIRDIRGWLVGWMGPRGIITYTGIRDPRTMIRYERFMGMPIRRLPDGKPRALPYELDQWLIKFSDKIKEHKRNQVFGEGMGPYDPNTMAIPQNEIVDKPLSDMEELAKITKSATVEQKQGPDKWRKLRERKRKAKKEGHASRCDDGRDNDGEGSGG